MMHEADRHDPNVDYYYLLLLLCVILTSEKRVRAVYSEILSKVDNDDDDDGDGDAICSFYSYRNSKMLLILSSTTTNKYSWVSFPSNPFPSGISGVNTPANLHTHKASASARDLKLSKAGEGPCF